MRPNTSLQRTRRQSLRSFLLAAELDIVMRHEQYTRPMKYRLLGALAISLHFWGTAMAATIPPDIKKTVAFVFVKGTDGALLPNGTAFFVGVPSDSDPKRSYIYLVTARHVLATQPDLPSSPLLAEVFLRLERRTGGVETVPIPIVTSGPNRTTFSPSDQTIDLAVVPLLPDPAVYDFKVIPLEQITSTEEFTKLGIGEGSEVFFAGLFTPHVGKQRNYPVVRFGRVALLTSEKVDWNGTPTTLYLIESSSYGGNSGSPVFYFLGSDRIPGSLILGAPEIRLAGVMKGAFQHVDPIRVTQTAGVPYSVANIGIAAVVPSYQLRELLLSEELQRQRTKKGGA
jgi:Trypsin-like peptidase domain